MQLVEESTLENGTEISRQQRREFRGSSLTLRSIQSSLPLSFCLIALVLNESDFFSLFFLVGLIHKIKANVFYLHQDKL